MACSCSSLKAEEVRPNRLSIGPKVDGGMEQARPHKRRRGARSCLACRKAKQRCDLPEDAVIIPSEQPQTISTRCHRCKMLKQDCVIVDPQKVQRISQPPQGAHLSPTRSSSHSNGQRSNNAAYRIGFHDEPYQPSTPQRRHSAEKSPNSISHDLQIFEPFPGRASIAASDTPSTSRRADDTFLDDSIDRRKLISPATSSYYSSNAKETPKATSELPSWAQHARLAFKPVRLLSELCWRIPAFQADHNFQHQSQHSPRADSVMSYVDQHWDLIQARLHDMRHFIPEMMSLEEQRQRQNSNLLLTTLALVTSESDSDKGQLKISAAERALNAVLQGAADLEEITALIVLGLYSPTLLLSKSSASRVNSGDPTGPALDGLGLFTSAASAANAMDFSQSVLLLSQIPSRFESGQQDWVLGEILSLRKASVWLTLGIQATITILTSDIKRKPFAECHDDLIAILDRFCRHNIVNNAPDHIRKVMSRLLIDIFRYQAWKETLSLAKEMHLEMSHADGMQTERVDYWIKRLQSSTQKRRIEALPKLRDDLFDLNCNDEETLEWLDVEISQMYFLSTTQLQAKLIESTSQLMSKASSSSQFLQLLLEDHERMPRFILGGGAHNNAAKRYASLLTTFSDRREGKSRWSPPPVLVCSCAVLSAKILAEEIAGRFNAGHVPIMEIDNSSMEVAVIMSRNMARTLLQYSSSHHHSDEKLKACDIFAASSIVTKRTADAIDEWACTAKSLRFAHVAQNRPREEVEGSKRVHSLQNDTAVRPAQSGSESISSNINGRNQVDFGHASFGLDSTLATEDDLDRLLREILATPIDRYLLPDGSM